MSRNKQSKIRHFISSVCHRHHFSNANTAEIVFTLLFIGIITRLLAFVGRDGKY